MAQPGSQNTTPSPVMPSAVAASDIPLDADEQAQRQKAIDTFLARTEFSKLARVLRARLSYASYKATHNVAHVPLTSLEHQLASRPTPPEPPRKLNHTTTMPPPPAQDNRLLRSAGMSLYQAVLDPAPNGVLNARRSRPAQPPVNGRERLAVPGRTVRTARRRHAHTLSTEREDINAATTLTAIMRAGTASTPTTLSRTSSASSAPRPDSRTPQPDDAQAAELMLFLATSPSPARPTTRPRQQGTPSGLAQGTGPRRVLFPTSSDDRSMFPNPADGQPRTLFPEHQLPTPEASQSTPPPASPQRFNLGDYINVSPSPAALAQRTPISIQGRRLFDEDPQNDRYLGVTH